MKKLLILLMVSASIVSCGKSGNNVNGGGNYSYSNPYVTDGTQSQYLNDLSSKISNNNFGGGHVEGYIGGVFHRGTWNEAMSKFPNGRFNYVSTGSYGNGASQNCKEKWIFTYCTYSSSNSGYGSAAITRQAYVNQLNYETKRQELMNIVNQAVAAQTDGTTYYIQTNAGVIYAIDTRYPIIANPSGIQSGYQVEYLYNFSL